MRLLILLIVLVGSAWGQDVDWDQLIVVEKAFVVKARINRPPLRPGIKGQTHLALILAKTRGTPFEECIKVYVDVQSFNEARIGKPYHPKPGQRIERPGGKQQEKTPSQARGGTKHR